MRPRDRRRLPTNATRSAPRATTQARLTTNVPPPMRRAERVTQAMRSAVRRTRRRHSAEPRRRHRERRLRGRIAHRIVVRRRNGMPSGIRRRREAMLSAVLINGAPSRAHRPALRTIGVRDRMRPRVRRASDAHRRIPRFAARPRATITAMSNARRARARTQLRRLCPARPSGASPALRRAMKPALLRGKSATRLRDTKLRPKLRETPRPPPSSTSPSTTTSPRAVARSAISA